MAGSTRALAKGSMGAFHKLLDPLLRTPAKLGTKEGKELVALAKKRFDVDSITRQGDNIVISKNGWRHTLDSQGRTIRVEQPNLKVNKATKRSATNQKRAGGKDRLPTDEGGHYGGRRFEGPTHEFNHFAQDMNFNRGAYKRLENKWQALKDAGHKVEVEITPRFRGDSLRPDRLVVHYSVDGVPQRSVRFRNRPGG